MAAALAAAAPASESVLQAADDQGWRMTAEGTRLTLRDASGAVVKGYPVAALDGSRPSPATALHYLPQRRSFVASFSGLSEVWEISRDPAAEPIFDGLVHDYRMGEAIAQPGYLGVRRTRVETPICALAADARGAWLLARECAAPAGGERWQLLQLDIRRSVASFVLH